MIRTQPISVLKLFLLYYIGNRNQVPIWISVLVPIFFFKTFFFLKLFQFPNSWSLEKLVVEQRSTKLIKIYLILAEFYNKISSKYLLYAISCELDRSQSFSISYLRKRDWYGDPSGAGKIWENRFLTGKMGHHGAKYTQIDEGMYICARESFALFRTFFRSLTWL